MNAASPLWAQMALAMLITCCLSLYGADKKTAKPPPEKVYGRVQFVKSFPDFKVKSVKSFPDLRVKIVKSLPGDGEWMIVNSFPDFKIQVVEAFEDFKVEFTNGVPEEAH